MKTLAMIALSFAATTALGQGAKPTLAQTVEYLQANYPTGYEYHASAESQTDNSYRAEHLKGEMRDVAISFSGTKVSVTYRDVLNKNVIGSVRAEDGTSIPLDEEEQLWDSFVVASFDMKDIEAIEGYTRERVWTISDDNAREVDEFPMFLVFKAAGGKQTIRCTVNGKEFQQADVLVPLGTYAPRDRQRELREVEGSQLFKAFQHLRKLSGAPEPLKF